MSDQTERFDSWAILELMGHVRTAGRVTEEERFGSKMGRIDVPRPDGGFVTVYFGGGSVYKMTPCSEDAARAVAIGNQPEPVHRWELPRPESVVSAPKRFDDERDDDEDDDEDCPL